MARRSDLGWWGRHPYFYTIFMTTAALACWTTLVVAVLTVPEAAVGVGSCAGLFGVLMTIGAVYAWHWLLIGRHRDRRANDRMRWKWDMALLKAGRVVLWVFFLGLLLVTAVSFYSGWRLDRYGIAAEGVVTKVDGSSVTLTVTGRDGDRLGLLQASSDDPPLTAGDRVQVVYDPATGVDDVIRADESPYEVVIPLAVGTAVAGVFVLVPAARRRFTERALEHWRSSDGRIRPPS
ncbi:hypothetical protein ACFOOK_00725 [Micromonospora krabiensis]|uniref:DUF3592 domain-containing protein n=1 Tax=Micromonospora krabiensis TaxID=307121 RepID=A0A1C3MXP8_9ACTN|nr:hypothetical protein [Micromonospora krabiensis]SBV25095.1 hypothetical protein GA0070620_0564 [Micromonospora krabiensis]